MGGFGAPFGLPFWSILEALGALLTPRGCPGVVLEGSEKEVEKRGPPISYRSQGSRGEGGGVPIGIALGIALGRDLGIDLGMDLEIEARRL